MKEIALTRGLVALVDDADYDTLSAYKWQAFQGGSGTWYAKRRGGKGEAQTVTMHRHIMRPEAGQDVDHINRYGLDNQRANLRVVTHADNLRNRRGWTRRKRDPVLLHQRVGVL